MGSVVRTWIFPCLAVTVKTSSQVTWKGGPEKRKPKHTSQESSPHMVAWAAPEAGSHGGCVRHVWSRGRPHGCPGERGPRLACLLCPGLGERGVQDGAQPGQRLFKRQPVEVRCDVPSVSRPHGVTCAKPVAPEPQRPYGTESQGHTQGPTGGWMRLTSLGLREGCMCMHTHVHMPAHVCAPATQCGEGASFETNTLHVLYQICRCHTAVGDNGKYAR